MERYLFFTLLIYIIYFRYFNCQTIIIKTLKDFSYFQGEQLTNGNIFVYHINGTYVIENTGNETKILYEYEFDEEEKLSKTN